MTSPSDTAALLKQAAQGDRLAKDRLLERHRDRLRRMIAVRMDHRLGKRIDPSDVVQETLVMADRRLDKYLKDRRCPFIPGCGSSPGTSSSPCTASTSMPAAAAGGARKTWPRPSRTSRWPSWPRAWSMTRPTRSKARAGRAAKPRARGDRTAPRGLPRNPRPAAPGAAFDGRNGRRAGNRQLRGENAPSAGHRAAPRD